MSDTDSPFTIDRPGDDRRFRVVAPFDPAGGQPDAIGHLVTGYEDASVDVAYMQEETDTLEGHERIGSLRLGDIQVLVGINLLRRA
jgi:excinuclease UvrABC helicase subunit UvrB